MGLLDWFSRKPAPRHASDTSGGHSSYLSVSGNSDIFGSNAKLQTFPGVLVRPNGSGGSVTDSATASRIREASAAAAQRATQRRNERNAYREMLHQIVRESMVRAGMLSASYKFKVLSLDSKGTSFLVMMDLPLEFGEQVENLGEIETMIINSAKNRHQLQVSAVYWRIAPVPVHQQPFQANTSRGSAPVPLAPSMAPAATAALPPLPPLPAPAVSPLNGASAMQRTSLPITAPAVLAPNPAFTPAPRVHAPAAPAARPLNQDPILADEVAALKQALMGGAASPAATSGSTAGVVSAAMAATAAKLPPEPDSRARSAKSGALLLTGFEETELVDPDDFAQLGSTQFGDIR